MKDKIPNSASKNCTEAITTAVISPKTDCPVRTAMSLESILETVTPTSKRHLCQADERQTKVRRSYHGPGMTTVTCLYGVVAQKSYGSEKRFLCPPPSVSVCALDEDRQEMPMVSISIVACDSIDRASGISEQRAILDEHHHANFKYLHVGSAATKARHVCLRLGLGHVSHHSLPSPSSHYSSSVSSLTPYATFLSGPIAIISKPSKKTARCRNASTCIYTDTPVSLFNRINSQTVRTKYLASEKNRLCAKGSGWGAFDMIVVQQPSTSSTNSPLVYGSHVILRDMHTGIKSPSMIVRKVEKGRIQSCMSDPVSQMQKIALQLASTADAGNDPPTSGRYLNAGEGVVSAPAADMPSEVAFTPSRQVEPGVEEVDDCVCWTIVNIAKFKYVIPKDKHNLSPPPSPPRNIIPLPLLSSIEYIPATHSILVTGDHLLYLRFWLGTHGPLIPHESRPTQIEIMLPDTDELLASNPDLVNTFPNGQRQLELPLSLIRQDGVVCPLGKSLTSNKLDQPGQTTWTIVPLSSP